MQPTDFQQRCRLSVGLLLTFPNGRRAKPSPNESHKPCWEGLARRPKGKSTLY